MKVRTLVVIAAVSIASFAALTAIALESSDVAVLRTRGGDAADGIRRTRIWFAEDGDTLWIESADAERDFLSDIGREPRIVIERDGALAGFVAEVQPNPRGHEEIRRRLRAKYGWRDFWVGLLTDTSGSVAIVLRPPATPPALPEVDPQAEPLSRRP